MNREIEELLRAAAYDGVAPSGAAPLKSVDAEGLGAARPKESTARGAHEATAVAVEVQRLVNTVAAAVPEVAAPSTSRASSHSEPSTAETVLRTAAMMTGVGPLVAGVMKLFGSDDPEPLPALEKFQAPSRLSVEAGLTANREYASLRHAQGGSPDAISDGAARQSAAPTVQVNIQALDSRSFLDRQDDIARAVREAMLHSNSLNDVVLEL
jgi:hypothetical protein